MTILTPRSLTARSLTVVAALLLLCFALIALYWIYSPPHLPAEEDMLLTPITNLTEADWQQAEKVRFSGTSHATVGDLAIGAGSYERARYTDSDGDNRSDWTVVLYIVVVKDHYADRNIRVFPGQEFTIAGHAIRVLETGYNSARIQVILPEDSLQANPRFDAERLLSPVFSKTPRLFPLDHTGSPYDLMILTVQPGRYVDVDGVERDGYVGQMQLLAEGEVVDEFVGHRAFERTLPDGSYLRIFQLGPHGMMLGITPEASATPTP